MSECVECVLICARVRETMMDNAGSSFGRCAALVLIHSYSEPNSFYYDIGKNVIIESFALCYYYYKKPIKSFTHIRIINLRTGLISRLY